MKPDGGISLLLGMGWWAASGTALADPMSFDRPVPARFQMYERMWSRAWFSGAALVVPENSRAIFFEKPDAPWTLTAHGRKAAEVFRFTQAHDRGVPFTPVAVVMDHLAGYKGHMDPPGGEGIRGCLHIIPLRVGGVTLSGLIPAF